MSAVEAGGRTRVVLNLVRLVPYQLRKDGNAVVITLGGATSAAATSARPALQRQPVAAHPTPTVQVPKALPEPLLRGPHIKDIDFRRGEAGEARIVVVLSDTSIASNIHEEGNQILIDFVDARLPERLDRRLDVLDFATPVKEIDTFAYEGGIRMAITPTGHYEHLALSLIHISEPTRPY